LGKDQGAGIDGNLGHRDTHTIAYHVSGTRLAGAKKVNHGTIARDRIFQRYKTEVFSNTAILAHSHTASVTIIPHYSLTYTTHSSTLSHVTQSRNRRVRLPIYRGFQTLQNDVRYRVWHVHLPIQPSKTPHDDIRSRSRHDRL
jgi:hypothetical protein